MTTERYTDTLLETLRRNVSILGDLPPKNWSSYKLVKWSW